MTRASLLEFLRRHRHVVQSSVHPNGGPQAAVVGVAVSDAFELVFDTLGSTRKAKNLRERPRVAVVIGGPGPDEERTIQYEGIADEPTGDELRRARELYLATFPDGVERQQWPGLIYVRVVPTWLRYSDYSQEPPVILEFDRTALEALR